jgi:hypothetical protein
MFESFENKSEGGRCVVVFLLQQVFVPLLSLTFDGMIPYGAWPWLLLIPGLVGFPAAVVLYPGNPAVRKTGGWIWVLPTLALLDEIRLALDSPSGDVWLLFTDPASRGLLVIPCLTSITYSLGILVMFLRASVKDTPPSAPQPGDLGNTGPSK